MLHGLMYGGGFETNFPLLKPGATSFTGSDGAQHNFHPWPADVDGMHIWYMEKPGKHFVAVRVQFGQVDAVLPSPVLLEPAKHMGHGKRFSAEPTVIDDEMAVVILGDMLVRNPDLRDKLKKIRDAIGHS